MSPESYPTIAFRAGDFKDIHDNVEVAKAAKAKEDRRAALERQGPMTWSRLVSEVCDAMLAAGGVTGYTFEDPGEMCLVPLHQPALVIQHRGGPNHFRVPLQRRGL